MTLPIFLTNQFVSIRLSENGSKPGQGRLVNLMPPVDAFTPVLSTLRIREILKEAIGEEALHAAKPVILSIASDNFDVEPEYDFLDILSNIPFAVIVPEYYYPKAVDQLTQTAANEFLNASKYGAAIPEETKIQIDSIAVSMYVKENIGKFIGQDRIIISTTDVDEKFKREYTEAMVKALSDSIQIAGAWNISIDTDYSFFPSLIESVESEVNIADFLQSYNSEIDGKLVIAPGVTEIEIGENDNFQKLDLTSDQLNKFKIKEDDKVTFRWKSQKSKFDGEMYGSKTGIRIDVRDRSQ